MSTERKGLEVFVGMFLVIGFGVIATMVVLFGRVGQGFQKLYPITVEFPNASGLVKGCNVMLSGAKVGIVTDAPRLTGRAYNVATPLKITEGVHIPRGSTFVIRTAGMLGEAYVDVIPPAEMDQADFIRPGETIMGSRSGGLDELAAKGGKLLDKLNAEIEELQIATKTINTRLLTDKNLNNLEATFASLKTTTAAFAQTSKDLDAVVTKTSEAVDATKSTLKTVDGAAGEVRLALGDFRKVADSANTLVKKAANGEGTLGMLISDRQTAENFKTLVANMRRSGVLFYKDRSPAPPGPVVSTPPPRSRTR